MKNLIYFFQFLLIKLLFILFKILPLETSKKFSSFIFRTLGKLSSADKTAIKNCKFVFPNLEKK